MSELLKVLRRDAPYAMLINVVAAAVITAVTGRLDGFAPNLVVSMCVGTIAWLLIDTTRLMIWGATRGRHQNWRGLIVLLVILVPVAQILGSALAGSILDVKVPSILEFHSRGAQTALLFTVLATLGASMFFASRERLAHTQAEAAQERARAERTERQALQAQLQLLQAQVEPHMLFNTLANLRGLIAIDQDRAQHMLDHLIAYLRATLVSSRAEFTTLAQEFELLEAYLGLMSVRMGTRLDYVLDLPQDLRTATLPPMLLQPLVENAIIHGLEPKIDGGRVTISAAIRDGKLVLTVSDNGLGLDAPSSKSGTHIGVSNTRSRLNVLYGDAASLALEPASPMGAISRLTLPLNQP